jgi:glycerol-3-phosphate acyltransferase PlsY
MPLDQTLLLRLAGCFLAGSIPFAVIAMRGTGVNILEAGSKNPGFNNVLRFSKWRAILTLIGDLGKGYAAVLLIGQPAGNLALGWACGFAVVLGHCYTPWLKFNGGKGIATSAGVMLVLYPKLAAIGLLFFTLLRVTGAKRRWLEAGTIASLGTWIVFTMMLAAFGTRPDTRNAAMMTLLLSWRHRTNFRILMKS